MINNSNTTKPLVGAIEAGGTKFVCAVGSCPEDIERTEFPTGDQPDKLFANVNKWLFEQQINKGKIKAIGIGSFGPVNINQTSASYGQITSTPKPNWQGVNILDAIQAAFTNMPIALTTDVNVALLGEYYYGNGNNIDDLVYITIGTGIGAGIMCNGKLVSGLIHPEVGHMRIPRINGDTFAGNCSYHHDCWEGLCAGPALLKRTGIIAEKIPATDQTWQYQTAYIASAIANIMTMVSPKRIIIGGSVRKAGQLGQARFFELIGEKVLTSLNSYLSSDIITKNIQNYIVPPKLGDNAGICGALSLAQQKLMETKSF